MKTGERKSLRIANKRQINYADLMKVRQSIAVAPENIAFSTIEHSKSTIFAIRSKFISKLQ